MAAKKDEALVPRRPAPRPTKVETLEPVRQENTSERPPKVVRTRRVRAIVNDREARYGAKVYKLIKGEEYTVPEEHAAWLVETGRCV